MTVPVVIWFTPDDMTMEWAVDLRRKLRVNRDPKYEVAIAVFDIEQTVFWIEDKVLTGKKEIIQWLEEEAALDG